MQLPHVPTLLLTKLGNSNLLISHNPFRIFHIGYSISDSFISDSFISHGSRAIRQYLILASLVQWKYHEFLAR